MLCPKINGISNLFSSLPSHPIKHIFAHHGKFSTQTNEGALIIYDVQVNDDTGGGLYTQNDSPFNYLRRDSAELFIKETIPSLKLNVVSGLARHKKSATNMDYFVIIRSQLLLSCIVMLRVYRA